MRSRSPSTWWRWTSVPVTPDSWSAIEARRAVPLRVATKTVAVAAAVTATSGKRSALRQRVTSVAMATAPASGASTTAACSTSAWRGSPLICANTVGLLIVGCVGRARDGAAGGLSPASAGRRRR